MDTWQETCTCGLLGAPESETCTFEVDCRPVKSGDKFIAFVSVCDGVDDAYNSPLTFGPRTWENGVGSENIADVHYCKEANPETGENPFVWHTLRVVSHPGAPSVGASMAVFGSKSAAGESLSICSLKA